MFKLLIECSKDISELNINFTDGTSVVRASEPSELPEPPEPSENTQHKSKKSQTQFKQAKEELLDFSTDFSTDFGPPQAESVKKPEIKENTRAPRVAHELQNLDI